MSRTPRDSVCACERVMVPLHHGTALWLACMKSVASTVSVHHCCLVKTNNSRRSVLKSRSSVVSYSGRSISLSGLPHDVKKLLYPMRIFFFAALISLVKQYGILVMTG